MQVRVILDNAKLDAIIGDIAEAQRRGVARAMREIAEELKERGRFYCPISPTKSQINNARKAKNLKPSKAKMRSTPGALARSIDCNATDKSAAAYIAAGSEGAAYARYIHDQKGVKWHNRGIGTVAKGPQADEKFLTRALADLEDEGVIEEIISDHIGEQLR